MRHVNLDGKCKTQINEAEKSAAVMAGILGISIVLFASGCILGKAFFAIS